MINVIIPAYNAHNTIEKTIASLAAQTISNKIEIIIIDDCSEKDYLYLIDKFENLIKIKVIRHEKNLGVGFARQTGLEAVDQPYFAFSDSDDIYSDALFFENSLHLMQENKNIIVCYADFALELEKGKYMLAKAPMTSSFPKLYRTKFIEKNEIVFPKQNAGEDTIFNKIIKLCLNEDQILYKLNSISYVWIYNPSSISRARDLEYSYNDGPIYFLKGFYHIANNKNINKQEFESELISALFFTFIYFLDSKEERYKEGFYKDILKEVQVFYRRFFKEKNIDFNEFYFHKKIQESYNVMYPKKEIEFYSFSKFKNFLKTVEEE